MKQGELGMSREMGLEALQKNNGHLKKKRRVLEHFQVLVGLYVEE